jgi:hypothetical protein
MKIHIIKLKADHRGHLLLQAKQKSKKAKKQKKNKKKNKKKIIPICLHEILSNRDAQTDFRTVQESEFIG